MGCFYKMRTPHLIATLLLLAACGKPANKEQAEKAAQAAGLQRLPQAQTPKNLILITLDTWRYDAAGFAGNANLATPFMDRIAHEGVVCERSYAQAVVTLPSHASILTGLYPYQHGLRDNAGFRLDPKIPSLATRLKQAGFATGAFVSAFPLDARYGLTQGFDRYDDQIEAYTSTGTTKVHERPGKETIAAALAWYRAQKGPRFLWVHLYEPHFPYAPPEPFASRYKNAPYLGEVSYADQLLNELFIEARHAAQETALVLTADHGEGLGEHGELTHGVFAYDPTLRVPLVLWAPGQLAPTRYAPLTRQIDLVPTLLDLLQLPAATELPGRSLLLPQPAKSSESAPQELARSNESYFESLATYLNRGWAPLRGCIKGKYKAIDLPIPELYDLEADPVELKNLAETQPELWRECLACLPDGTLSASERKLSAEEMEKLNALGYVTAEGTSHGSGSASDPKNRIELDHKLQRAFGLGNQGRYAEGLALLDEVVAADPRAELAYQYMSDFHAASGEPAKAIVALQRAVAQGVRGEETLRKLALLQLEQGSPQKALEILRPLDASQDPDTQSAFGKALTALGQFEPAKQKFELALRLDPTNPQVFADMGTLWLFANKPKQAESAFRHALKENPKNATAWNGLGILQAREGALDDALQSWEKAILYDPELAFAYANLAKLYEAKGQRLRAAELLDAYASRLPQSERGPVLKRAQLLRK